MWDDQCSNHWIPPLTRLIICCLKSNRMLADIDYCVKLLWFPDILKTLASLLGSCSAATALTYYGICMNIGSFSVDVFVAQFFSGLSETPCLLIPLVHMGRRPVTMLTLFLSGAACFLTLLLSRYNSELMLQVLIAWKLKDVVREYCNLILYIMICSINRMVKICYLLNKGQFTQTA